MPGMHQFLRYCRDRKTGARYEAQETRDGKGYRLYPMGFGKDEEVLIGKEEFDEWYEWCEGTELFDIRTD
ncbi:MAG: hypothetical protein Q8O09_00105 [Bacillota bacterium]|nr:hypothetical protein [Bacillota bacterium]